MTETLYRSMLVLWSKHQSLKYVAQELDVPKGLVKQVRDIGVPELGLAPLPGIPTNGKSVKVPKACGVELDGITHVAECVIAHQEATQHVNAVKAKLKKIQETSESLERESNLVEAEEILNGSLAEVIAAEERLALEKDRVLAVGQKSVALDNMQRSASEAAIARQAISNCLKLSAIMSFFTDNILENIEKGIIELPSKIDSRVLLSLANSNERLTAAMERAIKIEKGKAGDPEDNIGVKIGVLFNNCSVDELTEFVDRGVLPARIRQLPSEISDIVK